MEIGEVLSFGEDTESRPREKENFAVVVEGTGLGISLGSAFMILLKRAIQRIELLH